YLKALKDAGLDSFYLQFDGLDDKVYKELRGRKLLKTKIRAIENCRRIGLKNVVLVVTLVKGINDDQLGGIIKFAVENSDVVTCVNVQPISFAGRVSDVEREKGRITTYDFINLVEKQTHGRIKARYFYPVPSMVPISRFIETETSEPTTKFSTHPCCGVGTYIIINEDKSYTPINELVNIDKFLSILQKGYSKTTRLEISANLLGDAIKNIRDPRHREVIRKLLKEGTFESAAAFHKNAIMIGCMHFQDLWNFDLERVQRCVIHYSLPDGRLISFCSYNNLHREALEKKFSISLNEWRKNHGNLPISAYC
ncbi:MAG TPA: radical SAM protein, partial [Candidatus Altiarchaeales archaeon]|nr:radical SAM protein [Candidatus Altiarchaeales archaeon]